MEKDEKNNKVNEDDNEYKAKIFFFKSFGEMEEADAREMASASPVDHFLRATEYIKHIYADELKHKMTDLKISFK